jgi:hypothetical protein
MEKNLARQIFDKKFVAAACLIGAVYVAIVLLVYWLIGKASAGIVGFLLTTLATAVFKKFETLRFKTLAESEGTTVIIPRLSISKITLICFALTGAAFIIVGILGTILSLLGVVPKLENFKEMFELFSDWRAFSILVVIKLFIFFFVGYLIPRALNLSSYSDIAIGALLAIAIPDLIPIISIAIMAPSQLSLGVSRILGIAVFWLGFVVFAVAGALLSVRVHARASLPTE